MEAVRPISLETLDSFRSHPWLAPISQKYAKDYILAMHAVNRLARDLEALNQAYIQKHGRIIFTAIQGRPKEPDSFMRKLYSMCCAKVKTHGITQGVIEELYSQITDVCGVRFCCPYYDEVKPAIENLVRPKLAELGYATDLRNNHLTRDKDYLDRGDDHGYRSYHFFVRIPTVTNVFGGVELCLCEVQARTELQHVWAVKSHDLLYKPGVGWEFSDDHVVEDMRQVSNSLRAADQFLISIRDRITKGGHSGAL